MKLKMILSVCFYGTAIILASESRGAASGGGGAVLRSVVVDPSTSKEPLAAVPADGRGAQAPALPPEKRWVRVTGDYATKREMYCHIAEKLTPLCAGWATGISASLVASGYLVGREALMDPEHPYHTAAGLFMLGVGIAGAVVGHCCCRNQKFGVWVTNDTLRKMIKELDDAEAAEATRVKEAWSLNTRV